MTGAELIMAAWHITHPNPRTSLDPVSTGDTQPLGNARSYAGSAMSDTAGAIGTAVGLFVGTNVDDMVVLAVFNASSRTTGVPARWKIWVGQYIGVALLVGVSALAALGLTAVPTGWIWVLGLVPFGLGVHKLLQAVRARERDPAPAVSGLAGVIAVTVANGGDNIAVYTPVFRTLDGADGVVMAAVFVIGVAVWCAVSGWLVGHRAVTTVIERWGHWIVPIVFMLIGLYVMHKGGLF